MIDLIIPYYNNPEGLQRTLDSINRDIFYVTIVDDCSTIPTPCLIQADQVFRVNKNDGPGNARQLGINKTHNPYFTFIDTGDIFISKEIQKEFIKVIESNPNTYMFFFQYYHYKDLVLPVDNRMHGKLYKREFIDKYGITFCPDSSYMNEDVGFNRTCRIILDAIDNPIVFRSTPVIKQIKEENSLTHINNNEALYHQQARALALVTIHSIEICRKNNINVDAELNEIAIALYYWFLRTASERKEFIQEAWSGAKIFYEYFKNDLKLNQITIGNVYLKKFFEHCTPFKRQINILKFINQILKNENVPDCYLT